MDASLNRYSKPSGNVTTGSNSPCICIKIDDQWASILLKIDSISFWSIGSLAPIMAPAPTMASMALAPAPTRVITRTDQQRTNG